MGFGSWLKKALNPLTPFMTMKKGIDQARAGDWKGALKTSMIGGLTPGSVTPDVPPPASAPEAGGNLASAMGALQAAQPSPMGPGSQNIGRGSMGPMGGFMPPRRSVGGFMSGGGAGRRFGGGGGMDEGLRKLIQDYMANKQKAPGGGGGGMLGGGGMSQFGG